VPESLPSYAELPIRAGAPPGSSWGLWGDDDVLGTLNLLTPERVMTAIAGVRRGAVFNLNLEMELPDPPLYRRSRTLHEVHGGGNTLDDTLSGYNTQSSTQWDGFRHVRHLVHGYYNGLQSDEHGVHYWARRGIVGRGVLVDVGRWREAQGRPLRCGEPDAIEPEEIVATLDAQHTVVATGDLLLIRTGWTNWYRRLDQETRNELGMARLAPSCGLRPGESTAALLWDLHVAAVASDSPAFEILPFGGLADPDEARAVLGDPVRGPEAFLHFRLLGLLGIPIGEMWDLDGLADDCAGDGGYHCLIVSSPLNLDRGVGSPANAVAIK
jgi:kynurenine formamidase